MARHLYSIFAHARLPLQILTLLGLFFSFLIVQPPLTQQLFLFCLAWLSLSIGITLLNDYYDKDTEPVGGLERPVPVTPGVLIAAFVAKGCALFLATYVNLTFVLIVLLSIVLSIFYSSNLFRMKRWGWVAVGFNFLSGAGLFLSILTVKQLQGVGMLGSFSVGITVAAIYLIMQLHQVKADKRRGDTSVASVLGRQKTMYCVIAFLVCGGLSGAVLIIMTQVWWVSLMVLAYFVFCFLAALWWILGNRNVNPYMVTKFLISKVALGAVLLFGAVYVLGALS